MITAMITAGSSRLQAVAKPNPPALQHPLDEPIIVGINARRIAPVHASATVRAPARISPGSLLWPLPLLVVGVTLVHALETRLLVLGPHHPGHLGPVVVDVWVRLDQRLQQALELWLRELVVRAAVLELGHIWDLRPVRARDVLLEVVGSQQLFPVLAPRNRGVGAERTHHLARLFPHGVQAAAALAAPLRALGLRQRCHIQ
mmetsp:Transcript_1155/g.3586  ORF Transcript_1155/g.3586 Transcript_1155/m.3586 type:complete len:202 (+) Transcript_1155:8977-9582(+)